MTKNQVAKRYLLNEKFKNMEIKITVSKRDEKAFADETWIFPMAEYDSLSYPEDLIRAKIDKMRKKVEAAHEAFITKTTQPPSI